MKGKDRKKDNISIQLTARQLTLLISGIFFISVLSFGFGILVMKRINSSQEIDEVPLKEVIVSKGGNEESASKEESKEGSQYKEKIEKRISEVKNEKLSFFDTLPDRDKGEEEIAAAAQKAPSPEEASAKQEEKGAQKERTTHEEKAGKYTILVASYRNIKNAQKFESALIKKGYDAYTVKAQIPKKGTYYRVFIGRYNDKKSASKIANALYLKEGKGMKFTRPIIFLR